MKCQFCNTICQKSGRQKNGAQKLYCKECKKYQQTTYQYRACQSNLSPMISQLVCESVGIRGIAVQPPRTLYNKPSDIRTQEFMNFEQRGRYFFKDFKNKRGVLYKVEKNQKRKREINGSLLD